MRTYVRLLSRAPLFLAALTVAVGACYFGGQEVSRALWGSPAPVSTPDRSQGAAAALVEAHDCWTGRAPADVEVPGHVVVVWHGEAVYGGERLTGKALAQVFEGAEHGLRVVAFCR